MTKSSSLNIVEQVTEAGVRYLPAEQVYYKEYHYKVELNPPFKGLGSQRKVQFDVDTGFPERGREKLAAHVERLEKMFLNTEQRHEIINFLRGTECFSRMGGENYLIYVKTERMVLELIDRYSALVASVTGPINEEHRAVFEEERNVVMRDKLFYDQFRYQIKFKNTHEFFTECRAYLADVLADKPADTWRAHRLHIDPKMQNRIPVSRLGAPMTSPYRMQLSWRAPSVIIYLQNAEDFVHIKLIAAEHIESFQEIMLFDELN